MIFRISNNGNYIAASGSPVRNFKGVLLSFIFILAFSMGTAWSYEGIYRPLNVKNNAFTYGALPKTKPPFSAVTDMCKPLLNSTQISSYTITSGSQRVAGKIAVLGLILGVRFALELKNNEKTSVTPIKKHVQTYKKNVVSAHRSAQAVFAYRQCQKEYALNNKMASAR